jgi:hypothetical protein
MKIVGVRPSQHAGAVEQVGASDADVGSGSCGVADREFP